MDQLSGSTPSAAAAAIYVVDGMVDERDSLLSLLGKLGREVRGWESGEALLEALGASGPFILVASASLPGISGIELLKALRTRGVQAPTILISDQSDIPTAVDAIRAGAVDFIERPFIDRILLRRVQSALDTSDGV